MPQTEGPIGCNIVGSVLLPVRVGFTMITALEKGLSSKDPLLKWDLHKYLI